MSQRGLAALVYALSVIWLAIATPVAARVTSLAPDICVGGANSASEALALPRTALDCGPGRFKNSDAVLRSSIELSDSSLPTTGAFLWQTDPALFESMLLQFTYADGETKLVDVDRQMAVRNWFVRARFSVPVPDSSSKLEAIDVVVERPRTRSILSAARLIDRDDAIDEHYVKSLVYGIACGLLLVPIFFDLMFFGLLRFRFILWHAAMSASFLIFIFSHSGLIFNFFPDTNLALRFHLNSLSLAASVVFAVLFTLDILEERTVPRKLVRGILALTGLMVTLKLVTLLDLEVFRLEGHRAFILSMLPIVALNLVIAMQAFRRGSRAATYLLIAFAGAVFSGLAKLIIELGLLSPLSPLDDLVCVSMILLVLSTSAAVGDRFLILRMERDRACFRALKLGKMALSDPLTKVGNRRAFNAISIVEEGAALLVIDIDHFKSINDAFGHATGDMVLSRLSRMLRRFFNERGAAVFRLGGEEFAIVLQAQNETALRHCAELLREAVAREIGDPSLSIPSITISLGGALGVGRSRDHVFSEADKALYRAKKSGRNCSVICSCVASKIAVEPAFASF
ncbi:diguanylate cyclase [Qipengyuania sp. NPDC077563]|uniref:GGDEF domain-containing protein n=1 Tax=Qipengyuania sp. NPDC077563 TaxID=3364497 RepID=UPI00384D5A06